MKIVFFDLGNTLEYQDKLLPGSIETLTSIKLMNDPSGTPVALALISDFYMPGSSGNLLQIVQKYYKLLDDLGIRSFFEPVENMVTLSTEIGLFKPDKKIFRYAIDKIDKKSEYKDTIFITENLEHVKAARNLGMHTIHFKSPGSNIGEIDELIDLIPRIEEFINIPTPRTIQRTKREIKLSLMKESSDRLRAYVDPADSISASWVKFGEEIVLITDKPDWDELAEESRRTSADLKDIGYVSKRENLHLVIQKGNTFEQENPNVPILLNRGRFLLIDLDPEKVKELRITEEPCYNIVPLKDNYLVYERHPAKSLKTAPIKRIQNLAKQISIESFKADLSHLVAFRTRFSTEKYYKEAAFWARNQLSEGYITQIREINVNGKTSFNVIAEKRGSDIGSKYVVLVVAHLDSINMRGDKTSNAPGADDNGSGSAGLIQIAKIIQKIDNRNDVKFILFGGEEQGLFGSNTFVNNLPDSEKARIKSVINMDMIGSNNTLNNKTALLEGSDISIGIINRLKQAADTYTSLEIKTSLNPYSSDHVPFIRNKIPAVLTIEGSDESNKFIHTEEDTLDKIDYELVTEILKMNVCFVANEVGIIDIEKE